MANHKSAAKRAKQSLNKRAVNNVTKKSIKTIEKKLRKSIESKSKEDSQKFLLEFSSRIDSASSKGIVHKSNASRKISRLSKKVYAI